MNRILVTGGAGYIGSHTVKQLGRQGFEVVVFDNLSTGRREFVRDAELIVGDLEDRNDVLNLFRTKEIDAVLHFASLIQVGESYVHPLKYYTQNLSSSLNLLEAMLEAGVKRFIFSSSAAVYGIPRRIPIPEDHPLDPFNPYGQTKFFVERILQDYDRAYGLKFISLRYFNAAGADPEGQMGECHDPETHLIPNILLAALGKKDRLEIYGTDFPTPDGTAVRDYIHVTDLAAAHVLALRRLSTTPQSEFINLGTNKGYSVREVVAKAEQITGRKVPVLERPRREGDVPVLLASKDKAERLLGWELRHSDLAAILETAWRWHREFSG
ncbi:MAG: UDP-glucose 4-epimerase GalE [Candidatus Aminicenantes bacterium]|nr:UDP-glucose 4-epimerase GalE [Candidatus Aminicenantes bacterium]